MKDLLDIYEDSIVAAPQALPKRWATHQAEFRVIRTPAAEPTHSGIGIVWRGRSSPSTCATRSLAAPAKAAVPWVSRYDPIFQSAPARGDRPAQRIAARSAASSDVSRRRSAHHATTGSQKRMSAMAC